MKKYEELGRYKTIEELVIPTRIQWRMRTNWNYSRHSGLSRLETEGLLNDVESTLK